MKSLEKRCLIAISLISFAQNIILANDVIVLKTKNTTDVYAVSKDSMSGRMGIESLPTTLTAPELLFVKEAIKIYKTFVQLHKLEICINWCLRIIIRYPHLYTLQMAKKSP